MIQQKLRMKKRPLVILIFFCQNQGFCSHKIAFIKKEVYTHNGQRQHFPSSPVLENPFHLQFEYRENDFILYTKKIYLFGQVAAQSETDQRTL